ncbi:hypothetical protein CWC19_02830 [Pseudoalteromonas aurantia]|uniref:HTH cro/C1-type domain-containing protein n=2 Tax=Pseudoalteromonas aurantia TaxID=43654 RepID=A0A5S3VDV5_9GAMM|nr:hypothetical protein CWC19_02830 [Pseudoalteromonas aurantia]
MDSVQQLLDRIMIMSSDFASRLREIRIYCDMSQRKFADMVGIPAASYRKYEEGREPPLSVANKIANNDKCSQFGYWLLTGELPSHGSQGTPSEPIEHHKLLSQDEVKSMFIDKSADTVALFLDMDWFIANPEKSVDLRDCGRLLLKELSPFLTQQEETENIVKIK